MHGECTAVPAQDLNNNAIGTRDILLEMGASGCALTAGHVGVSRLKIFLWQHGILHLSARTEGGGANISRCWGLGLGGNNGLRFDRREKKKTSTVHR